jgi:putative phosphoesterase
LENILMLPNLMAVRGNHDRIFLRVLEGDTILRKEYCKKYGHSLEHLLTQDIRELAAWLTSLPEFLELPSLEIFCFHGSPWEPLDGYIYPDSPLDQFLDYPCATFILGHTHYPMVRSFNNKMIINPGSLGQPRHGGWPTYAVIHYPSRHVDLVDVHYDKQELITRLDELNEDNPYLRDILSR